MMPDNKRQNGQLWIDRNPPYRLKYKVNEDIYTVDVSSEYNQTTDGNLSVGNVVAFSGAGNGEVRAIKAVFPKDVENIIGVVASKSGDRASVLKTGLITLNEKAVDSVLYNADACAAKANGKPAFWIGAPVYWFIGETAKNTDDSYLYTDSSNHAGKITLGTPSGVKWRGTEVSDSSMNVGYSGLPVIGNVKSMTLNVDKTKIQKLEIHLNVGSYVPSISWTWPYLHNNDCGKIPVGESQIIVRHGLFPYNESGDSTGGKGTLRPRCHCDITLLEKDPGSDKEYTADVGVENVYGVDDTEEHSTDRRTEIYISTDTEYRCRISGQVEYRFDKEHP